MEKVEVVIFPIPGIGHIISTVELSKRLLQHKPFSITVLRMHLPSPRIDEYIQSVVESGLNIRFVDLPPIERASTTDNKGPEKNVVLLVESYKPLVKEAIEGLISSSPKTHVAGLIMDLFSTTMIDVAMELGIPAYVYFTSAAALLSLMFHLPILHEKIPCEFSEFQGEVEVPGMRPLPPTIMPLPLRNKKDDVYTWFVNQGRRFRETQGIIVNTFRELEPTQIQAITDGRCLPDHATPPIFPVGPLLALNEKPQSKSSTLIEWLDLQPHASVVFLCFGSGGTHSMPQIKEIAVGLEKSGQRFLWILRSRPTDKPRFSPLADADLDQVLPDGFLDRTKERGMVWPSWAPQATILAHPAVGGFVSHCGWNSTLESIWFGVPILAWPLYAEQHLNAFQLVKDYGLAVELRLDSGEDGVVSAAEVERGVGCLMGDSEEGVKVRKKMKEMREASRNAVIDGGSSFASLTRLVDILSYGATFAG